MKNPNEAMLDGLILAIKESLRIIEFLKDSKRSQDVEVLDAMSEIKRIVKSVEYIRNADTKSPKDSGSDRFLN
jgi:hypothetical protein